MKWYNILVVVLLAAALAACGSGQMAAMPAPPTSAESMSTEPMTDPQSMDAMSPMSDTMIGTMSDPMSDSAAMTETHPMTDSAPMTQTGALDNAMMAHERPAWQGLPLVDARTGATFTLADFAGKTVFVEPMATWCTNCRQQLNIVKSLHANLQAENQAENIVFVALSIETNLDAATLARYADGAGFDWTFAVVTPELLQELVTIFGRTVTNPPSTPHFIIRPDGSTSDLTTGIETSEQLLSQLQNAGG